MPNVDVFVDATGDLIIEIELSFMSQEDLSIELHGQFLKVVGERRTSKGAAPRKYLIREIPRGLFSCALQIPAEFDAGKGRAAYNNGMLRICVPPINPFQPHVPSPRPQPREGA